MNTTLYPLTFEPVYKDYIWGGDRIREVFHRDLPPGRRAESWEVSDRPEGMSIVRNGPLAGVTLQKLVAERGADLIGSAAGRFPLLVKIIDAKDRLSVQVHPDDENAPACGGDAKTEMWYALDAPPGTQVYAGLVEGTTEARMRSALADHKVPSLLKTVPLVTGEAVFVPGGRVHAIDANNLLLEVQQNSNTTYRLYDWGRVGTDGKPRELHVEDSLRVIRWSDTAPVKCAPQAEKGCSGNAWWRILACPYFFMRRLDLARPEPMKCNGGFHVLFAAAGRVTLEWGGGAETIGTGTSCLVPASLQDYRVVPVSPAASILVITGA
jgi:mannose-6-phosphate isomerase